MKISENTLVSIVYDMYTGEGQEREWRESATRENPLSFIFGAGKLIAGIENNLKGLETGDKFVFTLSPVEAYGEHNDENIIELPKSAFEIDGRLDTNLIKKGNTVQMLDDDNKILNCTITEIGKEVVLVDFNHPLAGLTLHFSGEVIDVHIPEKEEIEMVNLDGCECNGNCYGGCQGCAD